METKDIYWIAAIVEGEGWPGVTQNHSPVISVAMSDLDVMERVAKLFKARRPKSQDLTGYKNYKATWLPSFKVNLCGAQAAAWMMTLYPLMGARRREQIRESLIAWRSSKRRSHGEKKAISFQQIAIPTEKIVRMVCAISAT